MIDFCKTTSNTCDQICTPKINGFDCSCFSGFSLDATTRRCTLSAVITGCSALNCQQVCGLSSSGQAECFCQRGFILNANDKRTCDDVKECQVNNGGCPETCVEKVGSFECTCSKGSKFDTNTQKCLKCSDNTYGLNCNQTCQCSSNSLRCDPVDGCICNPGYKGISCELVINACENFTDPIKQCFSRDGQASFICPFGYQLLTNSTCAPIDNCNPNPCPLVATCSSTIGKFTCNCPSGFIYDDKLGTCVDIDECKTVKCPMKSFCSNKEGSYSCDCDSGYEDLNKNTTLPNCRDIDECALNLSNCIANEICTNMPGSFECNCKNGFVLDEQNGICIQLSSPTVSTTSRSTTTQTNLRPFTKDETGLVLVIVLPIIAVLILSILAGSVCFCWYRVRSQKSSMNQKNIDNAQTPGVSNPVAPQKSMFEKTDNDVDLINFDDDNITDLNRGNQDIFNDDSPSHSAYRTSYLFENKTGPNDDIFKTLEENARNSQKKTIGRPQSVFTGSSFSLPTAYYEQTTPYGDFTGDRSKQYKINDNNIIDENDIKLEDDDDDDSFNAFDNDDDLDDIIEAFNPNVQIPRPKIQINPLKIFKFGPKNTESEN
ncbi:unnamed protein product [Brachionus calyciflorus]|uniref:EGF-like domain-containing protein n=1 Tax=Brachionus calyciflorus TaxID=104777 RepID=A0A813YXU8_9BILA|nr:unnamed protein product [Brachionus calyciflorus]